MRWLIAVSLGSTVLIVAVWVTRTVSAERSAGRGRAQPVQRTRLVRLLDLALWTLGVGWATLLAVYLTLSLTGA